MYRVFVCRPSDVDRLRSEKKLAHVTEEPHVVDVLGKTGHREHGHRSRPRTRELREKLGVVSAVCKWMKTIKNQPVWEAWLPPSQYRVECELGEVVVGESCKPCPHGTFSNDNYGTKCLQCAAGDMP